MRRYLYNKVCAIAVVAGILLLAIACTDTAYDETSGYTDEANGISFGVSTTEQADMLIGLGTTRSADDETIKARRATDAFVSHETEGSSDCNLHIHRMPLPLVGIHSKAVNARAEETTRAAAATTENFHDSLTIWGYTKTQYRTTANATPTSTIFNEIVLKRIRNWRSSAQWPYGGGSMKFYAISPSLEGLTASATSNSTNFTTAPVITYTLPETATEMRDLLYGESEVIDIESFNKESNLGNDNKIIPLKFQHITTALRFAVGTLPTDITIKSISMRNIYTKATFSPSVTDAATGTKGTWGSLESKGGVFTLDNLNVSGPGNNIYIDGGEAMFVIPQNVTDAELQVVLSSKQKKKWDGGSWVDDGVTINDHTLKCSLAGDVWKKGYTVTYQLTIGEVQDEYYFVAEPIAEQAHSDSPLSGTMPVHSYRSYWDYSANSGSGDESKAHALNWEVEGYYRDAACENKLSTSTDWTNYFGSQWLTVTGSNTGETGVYAGGDGSVANYNITAQEFIKGGNHTQILNRNANTGTNSIPTPLNLSTHNTNAVAYGSTKTANCYIVNRGGSFEIPMVYGNKSANDNESTMFTDHLGNVISNIKIQDQLDATMGDDSKWTRDNGTDWSDATQRHRTYYTWNKANGPGLSLRPVIVWQDVDNLISSVSINGNGNIQFDVNGGVLQPGNCVIALQGRQITEYQRKVSNLWENDPTRGTQGYSDPQEWETFWTWHIWVTDEVYKNDGSNNNYVNTNGTSLTDDETLLYWNETNKNHIVPLQNASGTAHNILPVNLGWVPDQMDFGFYQKRECWVKLKQKGSNKETIVKFVQHAKQPLITGHSTIYQWGRPTALPQIKGTTGASYSIYGNTETYNVRTISDMNYWEFLQNPLALLHCANTANKWDNDSHALWSNTTKTVYDPCPVGFRMPNVDVFTGFSMTGASSEHDYDLNMWGDGTSSDAGAANYGGYMYIEKRASATNGEIPAADRYNKTVYMPATGLWTVKNNLEKMSEGATCISWCGAMNSGKGVTLWLRPEKYSSKDWGGKWPISFGDELGDEQTARNQNLSTAIPIRPMAE